MARVLLGTVLVLVLLAGAGCGLSPAERATSDAKALASATPESTPTLAATATSTLTPTPSSTPTPSPTPGPPPQVVASYPISGDLAVNANYPLVLEFDRAMDMESVAASLTISPAVEGEVLVQSPQRIAVLPSSGWVAESYQVTVAATATDVHGQALAAPLTLSFGLGGKGAPVPVLMYHHILTLDDDATEGQRTWSVAPEAFAAQMHYLVEEGWQSIAPSELAAYFSEGHPLPLKPLVISMDDGYKEVYSTAYPIYRETGLRPVLFVIPEYVGYGAYLDWPELQELVVAGFTVGAHGYDHSNLREASDSDLPHQLQESRQLLEQELDTSVDAFCYPYGSYDERTLAALIEYSYTTAFTLNQSIYQSPDEPYRLNRLLVTYETSLADFAELLP